MATRDLAATRSVADPRTSIIRSGVPNGNFELTPSFVAATSTSARWIDGSSGGSTTNDNYRWAILVNATAFTAQFDSTVQHSGSSSIKLSCTNTTGRGLVRPVTSVTAATVLKYCIPVIPSATYQISAWIKTTTAASGSVNGTWIRYTSAGATVGSNFTLWGTNNGTQDWTYRTTTVALGATDTYAELRLNNNTAGNVSDAWFDDIVVAPVVRTAI